MVLISALLLIAVVGCAKSNSNIVKDKNLQLQLILDKMEYSAVEAIEIKAVLSYIGSDNNINLYSSTPLVAFDIFSGEPYIDDQKLLKYSDRALFTLEKNKPLEFDFNEYQRYRLKDGKYLFLEPGEYEIVAQVSYEDAQGDKSSVLTAKQDITVK